MNYEIQATIWLLGILGWVFGLSDRVIASSENGFVDAVEITQLTTSLTFFVMWLCLKPKTYEK
jgi:hypothetical protein